MRVALCFFGQPRYIENSSSFNSHKDKIYSQAEVDVFTHFWYDSSNLSLAKSDWCNAISPTLRSDTVDTIIKLYKPTVLNYEKQINFYPDIELQQIVRGKHSFTANNTFCLLSHLYSMQKTVELLEVYVKLTSINYDFVIVSRYDNKIISFPNLKKLPKNKFFLTAQQGVYPAFTDHLFITDFKYLECFKMFYKIKQLSKQVVGCCPEEYKLNQALNLYGKEILIYLEDLQVKFLRSSVDN